MTTYKSLMEQAAKMIADAEKLRQKEVNEVIADIRKQMAQYGLSLRDIATPELRQPRTKNGAAQPKYKGPNGELWGGGRGRIPDWVKALKAQGKNIEDYRITS